ncbi:MAG: N-6 DNA methylase [Thermodesulfobacteriota bacterium]
MNWLTDFSTADSRAVMVDGLVPVKGYIRTGRPAEEVAIMEKAAHYLADAVFFEAPREGKAPVAQAFLYRSDEPVLDPGFAELHQRLWSWGGVPLVYRFTSGLVQLFRCAHGPDFESGGKIVCRPFKTLRLTSRIAAHPWWDAERLRTGTLWDDPAVCKELLSGKRAAKRTLISALKELHEELNKEGILEKSLRRRLLILSVLIAYLEKRGVFEQGFFARFQPGANAFFQVLANGPALLKLFDHLEERFNGQVFSLSNEDRRLLRGNMQLARYARLVEGRQEPGGQLTLWQRYSFADLPVELISHIYQIFVNDTAEVYTPHFIVRLMLGEVLGWDRLDRLEENDEVILDPACGSGIFLVESYKRLVLHWRYRNNWKRPNQKTLKKLLTKRLRGVDKERGAVELTVFSLCLALCDALEPTEIRSSVKLFPPLMEKTIHTGCFFEAREKRTMKERVGVIVGNPPFASKLNTGGAQRAYQQYQQEYGSLPDKQIAYLFLHESMKMLVNGGVISMLQQYNFLYNRQSVEFRRKFIEKWDVRELLDFISIRGLFQKGGADTKVVVVVAEAKAPPLNRQILHATFRRDGRASAEQGFELDYYDMHWLPRELVLRNDAVWRCDLLGGGRVLGLVDRLKRYRNLRRLAVESRWDFGEGWTFGDASDGGPAEHVIGKRLVNAESLCNAELCSSSFQEVPDTPIQRPRRPEIYNPPLLLIHKHENLNFGTWGQNSLTYRHNILGLSAASGDQDNLRKAASWLKSQQKVLQAIIALSGTAAFASKATAVLSDDILQLPFPEDWKLNLSTHELILVDDIIDYYRDLIRLGQDSKALTETGAGALRAFNDVFTTRINGVYRKNRLRSLEEHIWPGVICQPYVFGEGEVDWTGADGLKAKLQTLLREKRGGGLNITRIARLYDGACIFLLKPDRLRYWLRSIALRDADETLADLAEQGF